MGTLSEDQADAEAVQIWHFAYWYANVAQSAEYPDSLDLDEWADTPEPVRRRLAQLFGKHHVHDLSLRPMKEAYQLAAEWLAAGRFNAKAARRIEAENDDILTRMTPAVVQAVDETTIAQDMNGAPDVLAAIGHASALMSLMLAWKKDHKLHDIDWLNKAGMNAYQASDKIAEACSPPAF